MNSENKKVYSIAEIQKLLGLGRTKTYKKAIITLAKDSKIEL